MVKNACLQNSKLELFDCSFYTKLYILFPNGRSCGWIIERRDGLAGFRRHKSVGIFSGMGCIQFVLNAFKQQTLDSVAAEGF